MGEKCFREATSAIQIWSVALPDSDTGDPGGMRCEMVLCVKGGHGLACKWMPMGARDQVSAPLFEYGLIISSIRPIRTKRLCLSWAYSQSYSWTDRSRCTPYRIPWPSGVVWEIQREIGISHHFVRSISEQG